MKINFSKTQLVYLLIALSVYLFCWTIYRIFNLEITHDEAFSFHLAYKVNYRMMAGTANTHWLNTIFLFLESHILGTKVWMLRIHSLLALVFFLWFFIKILLQFQNKFVALCTFVFVLFNVYILDFFALARGYGMGMAFEMAAIYFILYKPRVLKTRIIIYVLLCLASFSVYTHLYFLFAFMVLDMFFLYQHNQLFPIKFENYKPYLVPFVFLIWAVPNILFIRKTGDLNEGLQNGFIKDTIAVYFNRNFIHWLKFNESLWISYVLFFLMVGVAVYFSIKKDFIKNQLSILLLLIFIISTTFFLMFKTPFNYGRTSLYYILLLLFSIGFYLDSIKVKWLALCLSFFLMVFTMVYFIQFNVAKTTVEWDRNEGVLQALQKIKEVEKNSFSNCSIAMSANHIGVYKNYYLLLDSSFKVKNIFNYYPTSDTTFFTQEVLNKIKSQQYVLWFNNKKYPFENYDELGFYKTMNVLLLKNNN